MTEMFIDSHHHLWKYNESEYGWIDGSMQVLKRDYLPEELEQEISGIGVTGTVAVQARQNIRETRWLLEMAEAFPFIKGVVGWVDLRSEDLRRQLETHAGHPKLVGVRHVIHDEPDDDFMLQDDFLRGISLLAEYDLAYDLLVFPRHLDRALELTGRFPGQRFVLDHLAKPPIRSKSLQPWKDRIRELAGEPNVWCKISGMVTEADHKRWKYKDLVPYMETAYDAFGSGRILLGSDWPVCRLAGEYREVMQIPLNYLESMSEGERSQILFRNAAECYKLIL